MSIRLATIQEYAGKLTAEQISNLVCLSPSGVRGFASKHKISLRKKAETVEGRVCAKDGTTTRYKRGGNCVRCKNNKKETNLQSTANSWLTRKWTNG